MSTGLARRACRAFIAFLGGQRGIEVEPFDVALRNLAADQALDALEQLDLLAIDQGQGLALNASPTRAPDPVHVVLGHVGQLVVDYMRQLIDIDAAGRDVRGHQYTDAAVLEAVEGFGPCILTLIAVQGSGGESVGFQLFAQPVGTVFGPREDQYLAPVVGTDQPGQ